MITSNAVSTQVPSAEASNKAIMDALQLVTELINMARPLEHPALRDDQDAFMTRLQLGKRVRAILSTSLRAHGETATFIPALLLSAVAEIREVLRGTHELQQLPQWTRVREDDPRIQDHRWVGKIRAPVSPGAFPAHDITTQVHPPPEHQAGQSLALGQTPPVASAAYPPIATLDEKGAEGNDSDHHEKGSASHSQSPPPKTPKRQRWYIHMPPLARVERRGTSSMSVSSIKSRLPTTTQPKAITRVDVDVEADLGLDLDMDLDGDENENEVNGDQRIATGKGKGRVKLQRKAPTRNKVRLMPPLADPMDPPCRRCRRIDRECRRWVMFNKKISTTCIECWKLKEKCVSATRNPGQCPAATQQVKTRSEFSQRTLGSKRAIQGPVAKANDQNEIMKGIPTNASRSNDREELQAKPRLPVVRQAPGSVDVFLPGHIVHSPDEDEQTEMTAFQQPPPPQVMDIVPPPHASSDHLRQQQLNNLAHQMDVLTTNDRNRDQDIAQLSPTQGQMNRLDSGLMDVVERVRALTTAIKGMQTREIVPPPASSDPLRQQLHDLASQMEVLAANDRNRDRDIAQLRAMKDQVNRLDSGLLEVVERVRTLTTIVKGIQDQPSTSTSWPPDIDLSMLSTFISLANSSFRREVVEQSTLTPTTNGIGPSTGLAIAGPSSGSSASKLPTAMAGSNSPVNTTSGPALPPPTRDASVKGSQGKGERASTSLSRRGMFEISSNRRTRTFGPVSRQLASNSASHSHHQSRSHEKGKGRAQDAGGLAK